jgi:hypothetical protein
MRSLLVVAAACSYAPARWPKQPQTIGCIDLSVTPVAELYGRGPVVEYAFGNRCEHPVMIDLASVRAVGRDEHGDERTLAAFDPAHEIRPLPIDGVWAGREQIEYVAAFGSGQQFVELCVDVGGIDAGAPRTERWICTDPQAMERAR